MDEDPIERLRRSLKIWATANPMFRVTDKSTQYAFGEDSEAFAAIGVEDITQASSRASVPLVVVESAWDPNAERVFARVWCSYGAEMWFVDLERRAVRVYAPVERHPRTARDGYERGDRRLSREPEATLVRDKLRSPVLPAFVLEVPALFASDET